MIVAARLVLYIAVLGLFGTAAQALYAPAAFALARPRRALIGAAIVGLAATAIGLGLLAAEITGEAVDAVDPASVVSVATGTGAGFAILTRFAALLVALAVLARRPNLGKARAVVVTVLAGVAASSLAWGGHAAGSEGTIGLVRLAADVLHLLAAGIWLGALLVFVRVILSDAREDTGAIQASLARFAGVGSGVVAVLLLTGAVNLLLTLGWAQLASVTATLWGRLLLIKLALFAAMLALAALNRFQLTPALVDSAPEPPAALTRLRISLLAESSFAVLVMALVAWLGTLSPLPTH